MDKITEMNELKNRILQEVAEYTALAHTAGEFVPGKSRVNYAGRVFDAGEVVNLADAALEFWLTSGRFTAEFEDGLCRITETKHTLFVNSGSSANLLAFMTLCDPGLGRRAIRRGDEVITVACAFPTTVAPIIQYGAVPVFVDIEPEGLNIDPEQLEKALSPRTRAVFLAHTLGNPFDLDRITDFCRRHDLWLIEDNCDALGSCWNGKPTGSFGDIGTSSFYPPHHITTGEGGAVYTSNPELFRIARSLRDWGRDCHCNSGEDNRCGHRFSRQFGSLPLGYDHKYVYSRFGYNLKGTDLQAAVGCVQLKKLPEFIRRRRENYRYLSAELAGIKGLKIQQALAPAQPSWFGFAITLQPEAGIGRTELACALEERGIQTRNLFAGNILRHPCFNGLTAGCDYRVCSGLPNTDNAMHNTLWFGVYPGLEPEHLEYMIKSIKDIFNQGI